MGFFSWVSNKKTSEADSVQDDYIIASKIATILEHGIGSPDMGLAELLKPKCAVVLDIKGGVSIRWLSADKPELFNDIRSYALISSLSTFRDFAEAYLEIAKTQNSDVINLWFQSMGRIEIDQVAKQALREMHSNAKVANRTGRA